LTGNGKPSVQKIEPLAGESPRGKERGIRATPGKVPLLPCAREHESVMTKGAINYRNDKPSHKHEVNGAFSVRYADRVHDEHGGGL